MNPKTTLAFQECRHFPPNLYSHTFTLLLPSASSSATGVLARARGSAVAVNRQRAAASSQSISPSVRFRLPTPEGVFRLIFRAGIRRDKRRRDRLLFTLPGQLCNDSGNERTYTTSVIVFHHFWLTPLGVECTTGRKLLCHPFQSETE